MKTLVVILMVMLVSFSAAHAQQSVETESGPWGSYAVGGHNILINVNHPLTDNKQWSDWFLNQPFKAITKEAHPPAVKLLQRLWNVVEVQNMRFSAWQIILTKPIELTWERVPFDVIESALTDWAQLELSLEKQSKAE